MRAQRARARTLAAAALLLLPTLAWSASSAAAAPLTIVAPGWSLLEPDDPNTVGVAAGRSAGDVTGDGRDDLLVAYSPDYRFDRLTFSANTTFELYAGSAAGVPGPALSSSEPGTSPYFVYDVPVTFPRDRTDFNGDGLADTAFTGYSFSTDAGLSESRAELFYGTAQGFALKPDCIISMTADAINGASWTWMAGGDFDGDGTSDMLLLETRYPSTPPPRDPNGTGTPGSPLYQLRLVPAGACGPLVGGLDVSPSHGGYPALLGHGDFNGDGFEDAVVDEVVYSSGPNVGHFLTVLPGSAGGITNTSARTIALQSSASTRFAVGVDLQGDGYDDLAMMLGYQAGFAGEFFDIASFSGSASGLATAPGPAQTMGGNGLSGATGSFGDFDGDGSLDLALLHSNTPLTPTNITVDLFFGDRGAFARTFDWTSSITVTEPGGGLFFGTPATLDASGDYDGDGLADLAVVVSSSQVFPMEISPYNTSSASAILFYYGKDILRDVSAVVPVGFDRGVGYPTYVLGWDVKQKAANFSSYDRFVISTDVGDLRYDVPNATFVWEPNASLAAVEILTLSNLSTVAWDDTARTWEVHFRFTFAWSFPTEDDVPFKFAPMKGATAGTAGRGSTGSFRVEKDLAFVGALRANDATTGAVLAPGAWVAGGTDLRLGGLSVVFEGTTDRTVPSPYYNWTVVDNDGTSWSAGGGPLNTTITADALTDTAENATVALVGLPDPGVGSPTAAFPFRVDADAPLFTGAIPEDSAWRANKTVTIGIVVVDPLAGADPNLVEYQVSTSGSGSFGPWLSPTVDASDPHAVRAKATALFENGDLNLFRFRAKDLVGNGFSQSPDFAVRVDTLHVTFLNPTPSPAVRQPAATVPVSILVRDLGASGVAGPSVSYRMSTDDIFAYGPWTPVTGLADAVDVAAALSLAFAEGDANYVQWRAQDVVGTGLTVSDHYGNKVDATAPVFTGSTPSQSKRLTANHVDVAVNISDGRPRVVHQSGVDTVGAEYRVQPAGGNYSNWTREGLTAVPVDGYNWSLRVVVPVAPGPGNHVEFRASDAAGNGPAQSATLAFHVNRRPTAAITSNALNGTLYSDTALNLSAVLADEDGDNFTFLWKNGAGDVLSNDSLNLSLLLSPGNYSYEIVVRDAFGAVARANLSVTVSLRPPAPPPPPPPPPVTQASFDVVGISLLLLLAGAAAAAVAWWSRRRRGPPAA